MPEVRYCCTEAPAGVDEERGEKMEMNGLKNFEGALLRFVLAWPSGSSGQGKGILVGPLVTRFVRPREASVPEYDTVARGALQAATLLCL